MFESILRASRFRSDTMTLKAVSDSDLGGVSALDSLRFMTA
ncbi:MAG: hypothetical protein ABWY82_21905 [Tardiphaga sp.]